MLIPARIFVKIIFNNGDFAYDLKHAMVQGQEDNVGTGVLRRKLPHFWARIVKKQQKKGQNSCNLTMDLVS